MNRARTAPAIVSLMLLAALSGCGSRGSDGEEGEIRASGFIEGRAYQVASAIGGPVEELFVEQGDQVESGESLLRLRSSELQSAQYNAEAAVQAAKAALQALEDQPLAFELAAAEAAVAEAKSERQQAETALEQLIEAYEPIDPPYAALHAAEAAVEIAEAGVALAEAEQEQVEAGPSEEELRIAQVGLDEAEAMLALTQLQHDRLTLTAPVAGVVEQVLIQAEEVAVPGTPLVQVIDPTDLTLTVYVPETQVALIQAGDQVVVRVDAYPEQRFDGTVRRIADKAQFTPSNVQTEEERVKLVFAVEIALDDPSGRLRAGMPADAIFTP
ncbi:MAG: efflux RND transporter periplasmic adaptor subunit [Anaerolineales bacterium]|jgi:HlyD family secretion protein